MSPTRRKEHTLHVRKPAPSRDEPILIQQNTVVEPPTHDIDIKNYQRNNKNLNDEQVWQIDYNFTKPGAKYSDSVQLQQTASIRLA